jgi:TldD protein
MTHQVDYADLYFQYSRSEAWSLEEGIVKAGSFSIDEGVGVRACGRENRFCLFRRHQRQALGDAAAAVRAIAAAGQERRVPALKKAAAAALRAARSAGFARRGQQGQAARTARSAGPRRRQRA